MQVEIEGAADGDLGGLGGEGVGLGHIMGSDSCSLTRTWYTILGQVGPDFSPR